MLVVSGMARNSRTPCTVAVKMNLNSLFFYLIQNDFVKTS